MVYILAIFRARTQTVSYAQILKSYGVMCTVVNTPREAMVACGVSVKFSMRDLGKARMVFSRRKFDAFVGFYQVVQKGATTVILPL